MHPNQLPSYYSQEPGDYAQEPGGYSDEARISPSPRYAVTVLVQGASHTYTIVGTLRMNESLHMVQVGDRTFFPMGNVLKIERA